MLSFFEYKNAFPNLTTKKQNETVLLHFMYSLCLLLEDDWWGCLLRNKKNISNGKILHSEEVLSMVS